MGREIQVEYNNRDFRLKR